MTTTPNTKNFPKHVAVIGAAGGLGQGILSVCREENIGFTAIVRSRPERIKDIPHGSRVELVSSLTDVDGLTKAFKGANAVISAMGVTKSSKDKSALLSANIPNIEAAMKEAEVDRILLINTVIASPPGKPATFLMRFFSWFPGTMGVGIREQQAVVDAIGNGAFSFFKWTLVRASVNVKGTDEYPVASKNYDKKLNTWKPVSYRAMGRWMLEEAANNHFVREAPVVTLGN